MSENVYEERLVVIAERGKVQILIRKKMCTIDMEKENGRDERRGYSEMEVNDE